jgi:hypothetical protein
MAHMAMGPNNSKHIHAIYFGAEFTSVRQKKPSRWWIPGVPDSEKHKVKTLSE